MINLGDKKWGVKDSGLLAYKQVGSKFFNKDFDFTRSSDATYIDKNGVLQTQSLYNLIDYSQDLSNNTSNKGSVSDADILSPFNNNEKSLFIPDTTNTFHYLRFPALTRNNFVHTISVFLKSDGSDAFNFVLVNISGGNSDGNAGVIFNVKDAEKVGFFTHDYDVQIDDFGNGWHRYSFQFTTSSISVLVDCNVLPSNSATSYSGNGTNGVYIYGAQLVEGTEPRDYQYTNGRVGIPRIDFSDGVGALLLEPQSTNLRELSNTYVGDATIRGTISNDASAVSPSGSLGVEYLTATGTNGLVLDSSFLTGDGTFSVYLKRKTGVGDIRMSINGGVDYTTMAVTDVWKRFSLSSTTGLGQLVISCLTSGDEVYIWGWQEEALSYPTSLINTSGSAVTRTADLANNCGTEQDFNSEEGVLYAEVSSQNDGASKRIALSDGTANNRIFIWYTSTSNQVLFYVINGGVLSFYEAIILNDATNFNKIAIKYKDNDFSAWVNGVQIGIGTSGSAPTGLNELAFDGGDGGQDFYGKARSVKYFPTALTDEELQNLTT